MMDKSTGVVLIILSFLLSAFLPRTSQPDVEKFEALMKRAEANTDRAVLFFKEASLLNLGDSSMIRLYSRWARHFYDANQMDAAEKKVNFIFAHFKADTVSDDVRYEMGSAYMLLDAIHKRKSNYKEGIKAVAQAINLLSQYPESYELVNCYNKMGVNYRRLENYEKATFWFQKFKDESVRLGFEDLQLRAYGNLGLIHINLHQYQQAKEYYRIILEVVEKKDIANEANLTCLTRINLGVIHEAVNEYDSAVENYDQALDILRGFPDSFQKKSTMAYVLNNLALVHQRSGNYEEAIINCKKAIAIFRVLYAEDWVDLVKSYRILGDIYLKSGRIEEAKQPIFKALEISEKKNQDLTISLNTAGDYHYAKNETEMANHYYQKSIGINRVIVNGKMRYKSYASYFLSIRMCLIILLEDPSSDPSAIVAMHEELNANLFLIMQEIEHTAIKEQIVILHEKLYAYYLRQYRITNDRKWVARLWQLSEFNKSIKLKGHLRNEYSLHYSLPDSLINVEKQLKDNLSKAIKSASPEGFDSTVFFLSKKYDALIDNLEKNHPDYYELKNQFEFASYDEVLTSLSEDTRLLNFFEGKNKVFTLSVADGVVHVTEVGKWNLTRLIDRFNQAILTNDNVSYLHYSDT
ncbi:MAG: tetratricopeptide repeat protein, partial [Bacteroidota bacterium]